MRSDPQEERVEVANVPEDCRRGSQCHRILYESDDREYTRDPKHDCLGSNQRVIGKHLRRKRRFAVLGVVVDEVLFGVGLQLCFRPVERQQFRMLLVQTEGQYAHQHGKGGRTKRPPSNRIERSRQLFDHKLADDQQRIAPSPGESTPCLSNLHRQPYRLCSISGSGAQRREIARGRLISLDELVDLRTTERTGTGQLHHPVPLIAP